VRVEIVQGGVDELLPEWDRLFKADPSATPFVSPAWARAWLEHWDPSAQPWIVTMRDGEDLVGLAPLVLRKRGPLRALDVLGKEPGDYWAPLARPETRAETSRLLVSELSRRRGEWDLLFLDCLPQGSEAERTLVSDSLRIHRRAATRCPGIELPATLDEYLATFSSRRRSNLRRHLKRLDGGEIELVTVTDVDRLPEAIARWQDLRVRQWDHRAKEMDPNHRTDRFRDFMLAAATSMVPDGLALVWEFRVGGEVAGAWLHLADDRAFYWYLGGFDPAHSALGLGKICILEGVRSSIAAGRSYFDFTRGSEPFKYQFGARDRFSPHLVVGSGSARSGAALRAVAAGDALRRTVRRSRTARLVAKRDRATARGLADPDVAGSPP
jgi:CelD/BcsL family acetyltransferase involved in cellulose biosynthesis